MAGIAQLAARMSPGFASSLISLRELPDTLGEGQGRTGGTRSDKREIHNSFLISTSRVKPQMIISTIASRITALAAASGNCR